MVSLPRKFICIKLIPGEAVRGFLASPHNTVPSPKVVMMPGQPPCVGHLRCSHEDGRAPDPDNEKFHGLCHNGSRGACFCRILPHGSPFPHTGNNEWGHVQKAVQGGMSNPPLPHHPQDRVAQCSTCEHAHCRTGEPWGPGPAVLSSPRSWSWDPAVESLNPYVIQGRPVEGLPTVAVSMEQIPGHLIRCHCLGYSLQDHGITLPLGLVRHPPGPSPETG